MCSSYIQATLQMPLLNQISCITGGQANFMQLSTVWFANTVNLYVLNVHLSFCLESYNLHMFSAFLVENSPNSHSKQSFSLFFLLWCLFKMNHYTKMTVRYNNVILRRRCNYPNHVSSCNAKTIILFPKLWSDELCFDHRTLTFPAIPSLSHFFTVYLN